MSQYSPVCALDEIQPGRARLVEVEGKEIALFNVDGKLYAMEDTCLHAGGPLHEGKLEGETVVCPWHHWQFNVTDGSCNLNPMVSLDTYEVRVVDGVVEVRVEGVDPDR